MARFLVSLALEIRTDVVVEAEDKIDAVGEALSSPRLPEIHDKRIAVSGDWDVWSYEDVTEITEED